jgi:glycosyltransferase involved in cell wall biosynthesis
MTDQSRKRVLFMSDHPLVPSGVGVQSKYVIEGLLKTQKYKFFCFGGAIRHPDYTQQSVAPEQYGEGNWIIQPVDGHGNKELMRKTLAEFRPDVVVAFTDPRFFQWMWEMEDEIRAVCPIVYWHVWDNDPLPDFNQAIYGATDFIMPLSLKTYGILQGLGYPEDRFKYVPHAEPSDLFKPLPQDQIDEAKRKFYGVFADREFILMWNNRNARRKMTGDVLESFAMFASSVGHSRVALLMHTAAGDPEGQDIHSVVKNLGIEDVFLLSEQRIPPEQLNFMYNCSDAVINIASNEGFGLGTLESLYAGVPIIVNMTGGLQYQIGDWWCDQKDFSDQRKLTKLAKSRRASHNWWGVPVFPAARNLVGSQQVPFIYDDRVDNQQVAAGLEKLFRMGRPARKALGLKAREWALENFGLEKMISGWDTCLSTAIEQHRMNRDTIGSGSRLAAI